MSYAEKLKNWFGPERTQDALAAKIEKTQAAVSRYATGERFPNAETARAIHDATDGEVPFDLWQREAASRFLGEAA